MFIRKKKNKSGSVSIQIIKKSNGKYQVVKTLGSSKEELEIEALIRQASFLIPNLLKQKKFDFGPKGNDKIIFDFLKHDKTINIYTVGPELVLGKIFDSMGFNTIPEALFKEIVLARLVFPVSKLKTVDYLAQSKGIQVNVKQIYDFLDRFNKKHQSTVEKLSYEHTKKILNNISIVFYDMTTLYFEAEDEDDLRKIGFSKDGKFQCPQIMLGLLIGENAYPIGYDIFEGNRFEGHTLIPVLESMQKKYDFTKPIVVADAGLLSKENIKKLTEKEYEFILGARIKNESKEIEFEILKNAKGIKDGDTFIISKKDDIKLIISYADNRAKKDAHNREKGLEKLKLKVVSGKLTKESINNQGYNKFLSLDGEIKISIDQDKVIYDKQWDGLKGYLTNTKLEAKNVINHYRHLWQIEKAFRISKTDLRIRPIFHYKKRRIESHICLSFVAYAIWKEFELLLLNDNIILSPSYGIEFL